MARITPVQTATIKGLTIRLNVRDSGAWQVELEGVTPEGYSIGRPEDHRYGFATEAEARAFANKTWTTRNQY